MQGSSLRAVIKLEFFAENHHAYKKSEAPLIKEMELYKKRLGWDQSKPWVARITGFDEQFGLVREFIKGQKDYSQANSVGSRGIYLYYPLKDGVYEVNKRISWRHGRRYFILVVSSEIVEVSREEVEQWLQQQQKGA